ncbi:hypothetical protein VST7929_03114 [Vibrio stylophorae]|uniref:Uncharacterized protein n=1 Tax=Vibrio stylophorae TaxID=659351 RepID=A0ABM8ZXS8_9VIBR|nr:hypothetical protein VST7929_03114 [Vibrio stylophorae]
MLNDTSMKLWMLLQKQKRLCEMQSLFFMTQQAKVRELYLLMLLLMVANAGV